MTERYAVATGNWSNASTWNGGTLPDVNDDVYANGFTVTIDQDSEVLSVRTTAGTTAVAGGGFTLTDSRTLTADVIGGTSTCVTYNTSAGNSATIIGNITGGSDASAVSKGSANSLYVVGDVTGGSGSVNHGIAASSIGVVEIIGNIYGGSGSSTCNGVNLGSSGSCNVTGNVYGGTGNGTGIRWSTLSGGTITGNVESSATQVGIQNLGTGTITITGNVTANGQSGLSNTNTGKIFILGNAISVSSSAAISNVGSGIVCIAGKIISSSTGQSPISTGKILVDRTRDQRAAFRTDAGGGTVGDVRELRTAGYLGGLVSGGASNIHNVNTSGGAVLSNQASIYVVYTEYPSGGINSTGSANFRVNFTYNVLGGILLGSSVFEFFIVNTSSSGGNIASGNTNEQIIYNVSGFGGGTISGSILYEFGYIPNGGVLASGIIDTRNFIDEVCSGGLVAGTAAPFLEFAGGGRCSGIAVIYKAKVQRGWLNACEREGAPEYQKCFKPEHNSGCSCSCSESVEEDDSNPTVIRKKLFRSDFL